MPQGISVSQLQDRIGRLQRKSCGIFPTPLTQEQHLARILRFASLHIKREDLAGLAFGGNYVRFWEFIIADALSVRADSLVHGAAEHSNQLTLLAAAARRYGLSCHIVARKAPRTDRSTGNMLLQRLYGAHLSIVESELGPEMDAVKEQVAEKLRKAGHVPYVVRRDRTGALSTIGAIEMLCEIMTRIRLYKKEAFWPDFIYVSSCGANHSGILLGLRALGNTQTHVISNAPVDWPTEEIVVRQMRGAAQILNIDVKISQGEVENYKEFLSPQGFGEPTRETLVAMVRWAYHGGPILDPIYTGPTLVSLIRDIRTARVTPQHHVVFVHTGGTPLTLFYSKELDAILQEFESGKLSYDFFAPIS